MARELNERSKIIRAALVVHQNLTNKELATLLSAEHKMEITPTHIAQQKQAVKDDSPAAANGQPVQQTLPIAQQTAQNASGSIPTATADPQTAQLVAGFTPQDVLALKQLLVKAGGRQQLAAWLDVLGS